MGPVLGVRSKLLRVIREFFHERGFLEVETPVRIPAPALELHIDAEPAGNAFLRTSPELHMKRLLAAGYERIFQMGPCFRRGERGDRHHPEYTMLEWYRANADYNDILVDTKALITQVASDILGGTDLAYRGKEISLSPVWERITVADAFKQFAGWDPSAKYDADRFDLDLVEKVEPQLPQDVPVILDGLPGRSRRAGAPETRLAPCGGTLGIVRRRAGTGERVFRAQRSGRTARAFRRLCAAEERVGKGCLSVG